MPKKKTNEFVARLVLALVTEASELRDRAQRMQAQIKILAELHGIEPPPVEN